MYGSRGYYTKQIKSDRRQILFDFTSMWNIKNKCKETHRQETQAVARREGVGRLGEKGEGD